MWFAALRHFNRSGCSISCGESTIIITIEKVFQASSMSHNTYSVGGCLVGVRSVTLSFGDVPLITQCT